MAPCALEWHGSRVQEPNCKIQVPESRVMVKNVENVTYRIEFSSSCPLKIGKLAALETSLGRICLVLLPSQYSVRVEKIEVTFKLFGRHCEETNCV